MDYTAVIEAGLERSNLTAAEASRRAFGNPYFLYGILKKGQVPSVENFEAICRALDLEFYVGPPRGKPDQKKEGGWGSEQTGNAEPSPAWAREMYTALGQAIDDLRTDLKTLLRSSPREPAADGLDDPAALVDPLSVGAPRAEDTRYIEVRQLAAAAGVGSTEFDETVTDHIPFRLRWLSHHGIDPVKCSVIEVRGESMEPTLPDGCSILVDHGQLERRVGCIFVVRTAEGLVVKRLGRTKSNWYLESDHSAWSSVAWTRDTEMIGQVRWMATTL